jgi:hypothetical protein
MTKIAFCFLTYENVSQPKLWNDFFNGKKDKCNIYIHNKYKFIDDQYHFHNYCIQNTINTNYADISVVKATIELFKKVLEDPSNQYIILLSANCIPLYNFDIIYNRIQQLNSNIISCCHDNSIERFNDLTDPNFFDKHNFKKHNPCIILTRQTTAFFRNNDFTHLFSDKFYAPDEHYFANICNKYNVPYINLPINYYIDRETIIQELINKNYNQI